MAGKPASPDQPTETAITQASYDSQMISIEVDWQPPVDNGAVLTGYLLYMAELTDDYSLIYDGTARSDITSYVARNLAKRSTTYSFKVVAINRIGQSLNSTVL